MDLHPLPSRATELLALVGANAYLMLHHQLVHDVAVQLLKAPLLRAAAVDAEAIYFGAATHDIGKALVPRELSAPGKDHEHAGEQWLLGQGVPSRLARFARTHGLPDDADLDLSDLTVIAADNIWKGKRSAGHELALVTRVAAALQCDFWACESKLAELLDRLSAASETRLQLLGLAALL